MSKLKKAEQRRDEIRHTLNVYYEEISKLKLELSLVNKEIQRLKYKHHQEDVARKVKSVKRALR